MPRQSRSRAERDRRRVESGEPPWGDVLPGTDEVLYYSAVDEDQTILFRTVAREGAFYVERYAGGGWVIDSEPMTYLLEMPGVESPRAVALAPRDARVLMDELDR